MSCPGFLLHHNWSSQALYYYYYYYYYLFSHNAYIIIIIIIIHNIIILSPLYSLSFPFFLEKNYTALLTESFRVSVTYLQMHTQQIANQPSLENFLNSPLPLHWRSSVY